MRLLRLIGVMGWLAAGGAAAMSPPEIYQRVSGSVWRVNTYDVDGLPVALGSAVVIAPDTLVTNCHVLAKAKRVVVKRDKVSIDAKLELWDPQRDVCQIKAPNLPATPVALSEVSRLQVGQPVYAIGNPKGLDQTMSAGLLSSIRRNEREQVVLLQTSAAISGGSSGGGLFDDNAALIGLTTIGSVSGELQNLNFAIPVDWIKELPQRHAKLSQPAATTAAAPRPASSSACVGAGSLPAPTNDALVADASRLPNASEKMREGYAVFLTCPFPRAFAISEGGRWWYSWSVRPKDAAAPTDPAQRALQACEKLGFGKCFLYVVDNRVVHEAATASK
ncbi:MAG TPA: S1C family serine protease [Albitalea sp.]|jgi:S1-C subfamily serine protease|nr:S1C family serine protease [Albitalea sp.]